MKNKSVIDTIKFTISSIINLCSITATSLCTIIGIISSYLGGIDILIIIFMLFLLFCHNFVIPWYKYIIEDASWNEVKPSIIFTLFCLIIIVGILCYRYIIPKVANAGFIEAFYEKDATKNQDVSDVPTTDLNALQKPPINTTSSTIIHIVHKGDTLYSLAKKYDTTIDKILADNISKYPNMTARYIVVGWELTITR